MLMTKVSERCPHCGNIVEGHKIKSYVNKLTRQGAKSAAHSLTGIGAMGTAFSCFLIFLGVALTFAFGASWLTTYNMASTLESMSIEQYAKTHKA